MFEFLNNISAIEIEQPEAKKKGKVAVDKNPTGMKLRVFKDGSVYPSQELMEKFGLEYNTKSEPMCYGYGFDVWSSKDWGQYPKDIQQFMFISQVPKSEAKVSLFGSVDYNEDGTPKKSVLTQGSKRPELVEMLRDVYITNPEIEIGAAHGIEVTIVNDQLFGTKNYVDLEVNVEVKVFEGLSKYFIPKEIKKGEKKGQMSYEERTNLLIHPLTIVSE